MTSRFLGLNNWKYEVAIKLGWEGGFEGRPGVESYKKTVRHLIDIQVEMLSRQLNLEFR